MRRSQFSLVCSLLLPSALASTLHQRPNRSLPEGVISVPLPRIEEQTAYGVEFQVGTPPQKNILKFDTGSPTIGLQYVRSNECLQSNTPCALYGAYDNETSSTSFWAGGKYQDLLVDHASGSYHNDTFSFAGITADNMYFGMKENVFAGYALDQPDAGIFGTGQNCWDDTCTGYPSFLQQLYDRKILSTRAYSVYLGPDEPDAVGTLLLGGRDKAKQGGPVHTIPMVDPKSSEANNAPFYVNLTSYSVTFDGKTTELDIGTGVTGILDTGNPAWGLPAPVWVYVSAYLGINTSDTAWSIPFAVDCKYRKPTNDFLTVGFLNNATISLTMDRLVTQLNETSCGTYAMGVKTVLGDVFLRNVYAVLDMDKQTVDLSEVKYTSDTDIVAL